MKQYLNALLLAFTLTLVCCGGDATPGDTTPGDAVRKFFYATEDGDAEKIKKLVPGMAGLMGHKMFNEVVTEGSTRAMEKGGINSVEIVEEEIGDDTATVTYTIAWGNGDKEEGVVDLTKVNGIWGLNMEGFE